MQVKVHILVSEQVRMVEIPDSAARLSPQQQWEVAFVYGQNEYQVIPGCPSVSVDDVIETDTGEFWRILGVGFEQLSPENFDLYRSRVRRDRQFSPFME